MKKMKDNIIQFPQMHFPGSPPQSAEEIAEQIKQYKKSYSDEIAEILWQNLLGELGRAGCDLNSDVDKHFPSMILILESIRSLHLMTQGLDHPLQQFAKDNISYEEWDGKQGLDFDDQ